MTTTNTASWALAAGQATAAKPAPATQQAGIPGNFITHRAAWREALETAKFFSTGVDRSYWDHELAAFDRSFDRLWTLMRDAPHPSTTAKAAEGVPEVDQSVMELAESVGLIGPTSRIGDLHAAIQRFHDLICVNATIKAATMAAEVISSVAMPDLQDAVVLLRKYRRLCQEVGRGDSAHLDRIEAAAVAVQTVAARKQGETQ